MKKNNSNKKKFLALCLSALMLTSAAAFTGCKDGSSSESSSSSSESQPKDTYVITNAGFETFDDNDGFNPINSVTGWTRSTDSGVSASKSDSGVISTADSSWDALTKGTLTEEEIDALVDNKAQAEKKWNSLSTRDKLLYYQAWKDESSNKDLKIAEELSSFYEAFKIDAVDLPDEDLANPRTHDYTEANGSEKENVLMIHNNYYTSKRDTLGTAQKFTSNSSVSVAAGTSAKFSVWVKTSNLQSTSTQGESNNAIGRGAYIRISHTVGGKAMDALEVANINTEEINPTGENNGWVQYTFYLKGSSYATTTFNFVLGLGSTANNQMDLVQGYAFFDDIQCDRISNAAYDTAVGADSDVVFATTAENKIFNTSTNYGDKFSYSMDFYGDFVSADVLNDGSADRVSVNVTTQKDKHQVSYPEVNGNSVIFENATLDTSNDVPVNKVYENVAAMKTAAASDAWLKKITDGYFAKDDFLFASEIENDDVLMLMSTQGVPYTTSRSSKVFTVPADSYAAVSFYVKTSDMAKYTGAGITLHDLFNPNEIDGSSNDTSFTAISTAAIEPVDILDYEDIYGGWQQCFFYVENDTDSDKYFTLSFSFGPTETLTVAQNAYKAGFAAFAGFKVRDIESQKEFDCVTTGTYSKKVSLVGNKKASGGDAGFDSAAAIPSNAIETGLAAPANYRGVYNDSILVGGNDQSVNKNDYAGLLNKEYYEAYQTNLPWLNNLGSSWSDIFGNATQPLVIYNNEAQTKSFGYIGSSVAITGAKTVSLRIKTNATATVSLINMDDDSFDTSLKISRNRTYWYDNEGNVCSSDPADENFLSNRDVAFYLQANGLYQINPVWKAANNLTIDENAYFANLSAYEVKDGNDDGEVDLLVKEGGASYNYTDSVSKHDGNDGIAFYSYNATNKTAYSTSDKQTVVTCLSTVDALAPRFQATESGEFSFTVTDTQGEWATVCFYIIASSETKNYRLEVWSGSRETANANAGDYVFIDSYTPTALTDVIFDDMVAEKKDFVSADGLENENFFKGVYSFYDDAKYLRYNEELDENEVRNQYETYMKTTHATMAEDVAYMRYVNGNTYELFADYTLSEYPVEKDEETDDSTTSEEEDDADSGINVWMLISSIAVAVVLLIAIASIIIRKVIKNARKKRTMQASLKDPKFKSKK